MKIDITKLKIRFNSEEYQPKILEKYGWKEHNIKEDGDFISAPSDCFTKSNNLKMISVTKDTFQIYTDFDDGRELKDYEIIKELFNEIKNNIFIVEYNLPCSNHN